MGMNDDENPNIIFASDFDTYVDLPGYPQKSKDEDGNWTYIFRRYVRATSLDAQIPAKNAVYNGCTLASVNVESVEGYADEVYLLTIQYGGRENNTTWNGFSNSKEISYRSNCVRAERNIEQHPDFASMSEEDQEKIKEKFPVFSFISVSVTRTEVKEKKSYRLTESAVLDGIDSTGSPTGMSTSDGSKWMKTNREISFASGKVTITDTWQYDKNGWDKVIRGFTGELSGFL